MMIKDDKKTLVVHVSVCVCVCRVGRPCRLAAGYLLSDCQ